MIDLEKDKRGIARRQDHSLRPQLDCATVYSMRLVLRIVRKALLTGFILRNHDLSSALNMPEHENGA